MSLTFAVPRGALLAETLDLLEGLGVATAEVRDNDRKLLFADDGHPAREVVEHRGPPRSWGTRESRRGVGVAEAGDLALQPDEVARDELVQDARRAARRHPERGRAAREQRRVAEPDAVASSPAASSAAHSTVSASAVPSGPGAPTSSMPACRISRGCPRCGRTAR